MIQIIPFLKALGANNNRDWFHANKDSYLDAKQTFEDFIEALIHKMQVFDPRLKGATAKNCVFRIYRDTRFSHDKTPYKINMGAYMIGGGRKTVAPGYYIHIEPGGCFLAGGMYQPQSDILKVIRKEIFDFPEDFSEVVQEESFSKYLKLYDEDKLKRPPQGYSTDFKLIEYLKLKHYIASYDFPESWISDVKFMDRVIEKLELMKPLNDFLSRAIAGVQ